MHAKLLLHALIMAPVVLMGNVYAMMDTTEATAQVNWFYFHCLRLEVIFFPLPKVPCNATTTCSDQGSCTICHLSDSKFVTQIRRPKFVTQFRHPNLSPILVAHILRPNLSPKFVTQNGHYGIPGCGVFKGGIQN